MARAGRKNGRIQMGELSLVDGHGRVIDYVRISLTDRCNYRCLYCMPANGVKLIQHSQVISYEEILLLIEWMFRAGIRKVRFTGGEPFVRKGLISFLNRVNETVPEMKIALTTNGSLLAKYAGEVRALRLAGINISLDTLDERKFSEITRGGILCEVLQGIDAIVGFGIPIKMNVVLIRGFNEEEIPEMLDYASSRGILLRLIEFMPLDNCVWSIGRFISSVDVINKMFKPEEWIPINVQNSINHSLPLGPAKYYVNSTTGQRIGIISAVTSHYCESCNRLRINSSGQLRPCLFRNSSLNIRHALMTKDSEELYKIFSAALVMKPKIGVKNVINESRHMVQIGG